MSEEILFPDGTYSGANWTGAGSNITEGISAADGNEISTADGDGEASRSLSAEGADGLGTPDVV